MSRNLDGSASFGDADSGTVWLSFLYQSDITNYGAFELENAGGRVFQLGDSDGDFGTTDFGFRVNDNNAFRGSTGVASNTDVNFFVLKIDFSTTASSDSITVYGNPTATTEGGLGAGVTVSGFDFAFDEVTLANFSGGTTSFDEIRIGESYLDVAPGVAIPEPSVALLGSLGLLGGLLRRRR